LSLARSSNCFADHEIQQGIQFSLAGEQFLEAFLVFKRSKRLDPMIGEFFLQGGDAVLPLDGELVQISQSVLALNRADRISDLALALRDQSMKMFLGAPDDREKEVLAQEAPIGAGRKRRRCRIHPVLGIGGEWRRNVPVRLRPRDPGQDRENRRMKLPVIEPPRITTSVRFLCWHSSIEISAFHHP
jgi:hypothetical protein